MPRKKIEVPSAMTSAGAGLVRKLAEELNSKREFGQPLIYEQEYPTRKSRVTVIWDEWADASLEERSSVILRAYELAEGKEARDPIALASGLTVPEATAAGILPFRIISGLRSSDPIRPEEVEAAMTEQGRRASTPVRHEGGGRGLSQATLRATARQRADLDHLLRSSRLRPPEPGRPCKRGRGVNRPIPTREAVRGEQTDGLDGLRSTRRRRTLSRPRRTRARQRG